MEGAPTRTKATVWAAFLLLLIATVVIGRNKMAG
jgi:hypothetical protein